MSEVTIDGVKYVRADSVESVKRTKPELNLFKLEKDNESIHLTYDDEKILTITDEGRLKLYAGSHTEGNGISFVKSRQYPHHDHLTVIEQGADY